MMDYPNITGCQNIVLGENKIVSNRKLNTYKPFKPTKFYNRLFPSHFICKGSGETIKTEARRFVSSNNSAFFDADVVDFVLSKCTASLGNYDKRPLPGYREILETFKSGTASVGVGFMRAGGTYAEFLKNVDLVTLARAFQELEIDILNKGVDASATPSFLIHSKEDGYAPKKILLEIFRSIQGIDLFLHALMYRHLRNLTDCIYGTVPECFLAMSMDEWHAKIGRPFSTLFTVGVDYTAFDRYVTRSATHTVFSGLGRLGGVNPRVMEFIQECISNGPLVFHDGELYSRFGGNPSGQYWTSILNSVVHMMYTYQCLKWLGINWEDVVLRVTGDDELIGFRFERDAHLYSTKGVRWLEEMTGTNMSVTPCVLSGTEMLYAPPGVIMPYLDQLTWKSKLHRCWLPVDARPCRKIKHLATSLDGNVTNDQIKGVYETMYVADILAREYNFPGYRSLFSEVADIAREEGVQLTASAILDSVYCGTRWESSLRKEE
jgi:hypothetical protein